MDHEEEEYIDDEFRSAEEIAKRSLILGALLSTVYGASIQEAKSWLKGEGLWKELSPDELEYLKKPTNKKARIKLSWRSEALVSLLWSINKIDSLPSLTTECDTEFLKSVLVVPPNSTANFISNAKLRSEEEISEAYEEVYDSHWSVRDAQIHNKPMPNNINSGVVYERHFGFNYVKGYGSLPWDEITCDT